MHKNTQIIDIPMTAVYDVWRKFHAMPIIKVMDTDMKKLWGTSSTLRLTRAMGTSSRASTNFLEFSLFYCTPELCSHMILCVHGAQSIFWSSNLPWHDILKQCWLFDGQGS